LKKGEQKNCKIVKTQWFLTIIFALPLCFNTGGGGGGAKKRLWAEISQIPGSPQK
jgi:hypothetical protein